MIDPIRTLANIWRVVHTPSSKTAHKGAGDHYAADFDTIRNLIRPFVVNEWLEPYVDANGKPKEGEKGNDPPCEDGRGASQEN